MLNPLDSPIQPGVTYILERDRVVPLVKILESLDAERLAAWIEITDVPQFDSTLVGRGALFRPKGLLTKKVIYESRFLPARTQLAQLQSAQDLLEILNRPVTGFSYNLDAEQRIQGLRSTLHRAITLCEGDPAAGKKVVVCTEVIAMKGGTLQMTGAMPKRDTTRVQGYATAMLEDSLAGSGLVVSWDELKYHPEMESWKASVPVADEVVLRANFQQLVINPASTIARVDFALGMSVWCGVSIDDKPVASLQ